jgi:hypothetical protein
VPPWGLAATLSRRAERSPNPPISVFPFGRRPAEVGVGEAQEASGLGRVTDRPISRCYRPIDQPSLTTSRLPLYAIRECFREPVELAVFIWSLELGRSVVGRDCAADSVVVCAADLEPLPTEFSRVYQGPSLAPLGGPSTVFCETGWDGWGRV